MEKQTPLSEIRERGLKQSQGSHEKERMQVPKPHGEKCHDPARLDKIVKAWRETWRPGTRPESSTRPAAASPEWTRRLGMLEQLEERQAELQRKLDARQAGGPERRPVDAIAKLGREPRQPFKRVALCTVWRVQRRGSSEKSWGPFLITKS